MGDCSPPESPNGMTDTLRKMAADKSFRLSINERAAISYALKQIRLKKHDARMRSQPLSDTVKTWRASRDLSAPQAAIVLEISVRTLEGIEQGRPFKYEKILRLALERA